MGANARKNPFNKWKNAEGGTSQFKLYDRFGREVGTGDVVYLMAKTDAMWKVEEVKPIMDPKAPPGLMQIVLTSIIIAPLAGGVPQTEMLKVMDTEEADPLLNPETEKFRKSALEGVGADIEKGRDGE